MMTFGDGHVYGWMTYGGRSSIEWCRLTSDSFEDVECQDDLPAVPCIED